MLSKKKRTTYTFSLPAARHFAYTIRLPQQECISLYFTLYVRWRTSTEQLAAAHSNALSINANLGAVICNNIRRSRWKPKWYTHSTSAHLHMYARNSICEIEGLVQRPTTHPCVRNHFIGATFIGELPRPSAGCFLYGETFLVL